jgi:hypothetical protein
MKFAPFHAFLLFAGAAIALAGVVTPTAQASCTVVVDGTCGTASCLEAVPCAGTGNCTVVIAGTCQASGSCTVVIASTCTATGRCLVTTTDVLDPAECQGACTISVGSCHSGGFSGNVGTCLVNVGNCNGNGHCIVNLVFQCNGSCDVNVGLCSSIGPGRCEVNAGECHGSCTINLGLCAVGETCTLQIIVCNIQ